MSFINLTENMTKYITIIIAGAYLCRRLCACEYIVRDNVRFAF